MAKMARQGSGQEVPAEQFLRDFHAWTDDRLWIYDHVGKVKAERMLAVATYVRKELGVQHLVIDSLMKCGLGSDDYNGQKDFVDSLCAIARDTGLHIHLVVHMRKGETEHKPADKFDVKGAGEITDLVDNLLIVWKDQRKADQIEQAEAAIAKTNDDKRLGDKDRAQTLETQRKALSDLRGKPDALVRIAKQRHFEYEGKFVFWFHPASQQYLERPYGKADYLDSDELHGTERAATSRSPLFDDEAAYEGFGA
jgi:twinkle protein